MSTKRKAPAKLAAPVAKKSATIPSKNTIDESHTSVANTDALHGSNPETIEISSDAESEYSSGQEDVTEPVNGTREVAQPRSDKKSKTISTTAADDSNDAGSDAEGGSPTFGELLRGNETIDVSSLLQQAVTSTTVQPSRTAIAPPSLQSLTTVLTQALKTDDTELLESCLHTTDLTTIRNTIERIDSSLAGILLNKLAARLYRRPGRAGNLMIWVKWTIIAHGGALSSQPKVIQSLNGLQKVLAERAKGLNSLLALKGKLDLLEGQMELRRKMKRGASSGKNGNDSDDEDEVDDNVIWVEGETQDSRLANGLADDEDAHMANGLIPDSDGEDDDSDAEEDEDEDGAEESVDEDEVDHDDVDESMGEDEESDAEPAPPSKLQKVAGFFSKRK
ncbi:small nucleolar ribonucleoprotein complex component (Utp5) [Cordyceps javanica]|uniref:Small nucleolar ribonucleoprotein complex component (Utp5) n=1 Tax=Cordyceps javanica TaxID=43265 RepID=A0A545VD36_9HYPO|nr:small nucleolar ribonucleoprotein complex component (Utp5) [Cordyceps javanica]TQW10688.1 small nucleolar ribonucleoprotein complex component (Utp5) [Cordyceps javanica]